MAHIVTEALSDERMVEEVSTGVNKSVWFHGLQQCIVHSWAWECSYKINYQPVHERVTASAIIVST